MHDVSVADGLYAELYEAYAKIQSVYYNGAENINMFAVDFQQFQHSVLFAFDTSRSDEAFMNGAVDIRLEINASKNIPSKTAAYCLVIYENEFEYSPLNEIVIRKV